VYEELSSYRIQKDGRTGILMLPSSSWLPISSGSWLGALTRIMEDVGPDSAFADVQFPHENPALRAGYLASFAHSFIISHAHLDHILGMILGCASLPGKKNVYGLRPTLENLLDVFNGKIWPKLASFTDDGPSAVYLLKA
jgi:cAMP phosphodiesterase